MQSATRVSVGTLSMVRGLSDGCIPLSGKLHRRIGRLLNELKIPEYWKGREYTIQAVAHYIYYIVYGKEIVMKDIYHRISEDYKTGHGTICAQIRRAYMATFENYTPLQIEVFEYGTFPKLAKPLTINQFIEKVSNYILQDKDL